MQKNGLFIIFLMLLALFSAAPVQAQSADWVALQSDSAAITSAGQIFVVAVSGAVQTPINGIGAILSYDPACVKINSREAGTIFANQPVREFLGSNRDGKLDITYYLEGQSASVTGEGTFFQVTFETLGICEAKIALDKKTLVLGVRQANGLSKSLTGVEIRAETIQLTTAAGEEAAQPVPAVKISALPTDTRTPVSSSASKILLATGVGIPLLAGVGVLIFALKKPAVKLAPQARPSARDYQPRLLVENGTKRPRSYLLKAQRTLIGRHSDCTIQLDGRGISHQHAEISERDGVFYLADLRSRNGTYLNGKLLEKGYYPLRNGAEIKFGGEITCRFVE